MSNWAYVVVAYSLVWGAMGVYSLLLLRRIGRARRRASQHRDPAGHEQRSAGDTTQVVGEAEKVRCDTPLVR